MHKRQIKDFLRASLCLSVLQLVLIQYITHFLHCDSSTPSLHRYSHLLLRKCCTQNCSEQRNVKGYWYEGSAWTVVLSSQQVSLKTTEWLSNVKHCVGIGLFCYQCVSRLMSGHQDPPYSCYWLLSTVWAACLNWLVSSFLIPPNSFNALPSDVLWRSQWPSASDRMNH